jgi:hypothetical protein
VACSFPDQARSVTAASCDGAPRQLHTCNSRMTSTNSHNCHIGNKKGSAGATNGFLSVAAGESLADKLGGCRTLDLLGGDCNQEVVTPGPVDVEITLE